MALLQTKTALGIVEGLPAWNQAYTVFKGIPFAAPPVGDFRWKAPQLPQPWEGVRKCYKFSATPMEGGGAPGGPAPNRPNPMASANFFAREYEKSEDCLYLNIWTPAKTDAEKLPVAVYIHGGGFRGGYSFANAYDGECFNKRGIVYVSIAYRVNVFGFVAHPELTAEQGGHSGNYGLMDQIAALRWIKENIAAFGGDPEHIAVFGQSAGGMSVNHLCTSPLTEGLFQYAIIQSGGGGLNPTQSEKYQNSLAGAEEIGKAFFEFAGFADLNEARAADAERVLNKLNEFETAVKKAESGSLADLKDIMLMFQPAVDGYVLPKSSRDVYLANEQHKIHYMIGSAEGDKHIFGDTLPLTTSWARNLAALKNDPAYVYYFTYVPPGTTEAHHSVEHNYVFQTLLRASRAYTGFDFDLSNELCDYWSNFIKCGNPNGSGEQKWTPYTEASPCYLEIAKVRRMAEYK